MANQRIPNIPAGEVTHPQVYLNRRNFLRAGVLAASLVATGGIYRAFHPARVKKSGLFASKFPATTQSASAGVPAVNEPITSFDAITSYNNFYEFSTDKGEVASAAAKFVARPWTVAVGGLVAKPATFDLDELLKIAPIEQRVYRMRCVEAWSMVIPWDGFPLARLLDRVQPLSSAKYVAFTTLLDPKRMPNQRGRTLDWPYVEGLRMDEAMHPLTLLASGVYGQPMPNQNGAPLRLVVPWKYGFKGIKSIVKIELVDKQPPTTWNLAGPGEYGFYANVNPQVDHPRWSQATERRIEGSDAKPTLMFNGYAEQVGHLYSGMDLTTNY